MDPFLRISMKMIAQSRLWIQNGKMFARRVPLECSNESNNVDPDIRENELEFWIDPEIILISNPFLKMV